MNGYAILTAMLPEHLLLLGMLAILGLEIRSGRPSDGFALSVPTVEHRALEVDTPEDVARVEARLQATGRC